MNHPGNTTLVVGIDGDQFIPLAVNADGSLVAPGAVEASEQELTFVTGTAASSGDNTLIAAPAVGTAIKIRALSIQNETAVATTSILKFGSVAKWRLRSKDDGNGLILTFNAGEEWVVDSALALVLNLSGANTHGYSVAYFTEAV